MTDYFLDFARLGAGWVMYLLILMSIVSVGVMVDRFIWFANKSTDTERLVRELRGAFERKEVDRFVHKYTNDPAVVVRVALRGLEERGKGPEATAEAMHAERIRWRRAGDANLIVLGTLGNNVPFVGLFGTVLGVINAFDQLSGQDTDQTQKLVVIELAKALTATAVGLMVAIPAVVAFNYFSRKLKGMMASSDEVAHSLLVHVYGEAGKPMPAPAGDKLPSAKEAKADGGA